jgi:hypothetical protein
MKKLSLILLGFLGLSFVGKLTSESAVIKSEKIYLNDNDANNPNDGCPTLCAKNGQVFNGNWWNKERGDKSRLPYQISPSSCECEGSGNQEFIAEKVNRHYLNDNDANNPNDGCPSVCKKLGNRIFTDVWADEKNSSGSFCVCRLHKKATPSHRVYKNTKDANNSKDGCISVCDKLNNRIFFPGDLWWNQKVNGRNTSFCECRVTSNRTYRANPDGKGLLLESTSQN